MTNADVKEFRLRLDGIERTQRDLATAMQNLCSLLAGRSDIEPAGQEATQAFARMYVRQAGLLDDRRPQ